MRKHLPELVELQQMIENLPPQARAEVVGQVSLAEHSKHRLPEYLPLYKVTLGPNDPTSPVLILTGGVHGLERIGSQVVLSFLKTSIELLKFDEFSANLFSKIRVVFFPLVNPGGIWLRQRSNPRGVDLMRNAPIEADGKVALLAGGHRISPMLPWYRGSDTSMEVESATLVSEVKKEIFESSFSISLDVHSGFGLKDQIWFPFAKSTDVFPEVTKIVAWKRLLDQVYPHHIYRIEPQSLNYLTHGDIWDHLWFEHNQYWGNKSPAAPRTYLPLCLEMGSWTWVKKNPLQLFSSLGLFDPMVPHRRSRTLRRHNALFDFLTRCLVAPEKWAHFSDSYKTQLYDEAQVLWYKQGK